MLDDNGIGLIARWTPPILSAMWLRINTGLVLIVSTMSMVTAIYSVLVQLLKITNRIAYRLDGKAKRLEAMV